MIPGDGLRGQPVPSDHRLLADHRRRIALHGGPTQPSDRLRKRLRLAVGPHHPDVDRLDHGPHRRQPLRRHLSSFPGPQAVHDEAGPDPSGLPGHSDRPLQYSQISGIPDRHHPELGQQLLVSQIRGRPNPAEEFIRVHSPLRNRSLLSVRISRATSRTHPTERVSGPGTLASQATPQSQPTSWIAGKHGGPGEQPNSGHDRHHTHLPRLPNTRVPQPGALLRAGRPGLHVRQQLLFLLPLEQHCHFGKFVRQLRRLLRVSEAVPGAAARLLRTEQTTSTGNGLQRKVSDEETEDRNHSVSSPPPESDMQEQRQCGGQLQIRACDAVEMKQNR